MQTIFRLGKSILGPNYFCLNFTLFRSFLPSWLNFFPWCGSLQIRFWFSSHSNQGFWANWSFWSDAPLFKSYLGFTSYSCWSLSIQLDLWTFWVNVSICAWTYFALLSSYRCFWVDWIAFTGAYSPYLVFKLFSEFSESWWSFLQTLLGVCKSQLFFILLTQLIFCVFFWSDMNFFGQQCLPLNTFEVVFAGILCLLNFSP